MDIVAHLPRSEKAAAGQLFEGIPQEGLVRDITVNETVPGFWALYDTPEARHAALTATFLTWQTGPDRSVLLNYAVTWKDVGGYGLHLSHSAWPGRHGHVG